MARFKVTLAVGIFILIHLSASIVSGNVYYLDPDGVDSTGDGSRNNPWQLLSYACSQSAENDTIYINPGTYPIDSDQCVLPIGVDIIGPGVISATLFTNYDGGEQSYNSYIFGESEESEPVTDGNHIIRDFTLDGDSKQCDIGIRIRYRDEILICNIKVQNFYRTAVRVTGHGGYGVSWADDMSREPAAYGENVVIHDIETNNTCYHVTSPGFNSSGAITIDALDSPHIYNLTLRENYEGGGVGVKLAHTGWFKSADFHDWDIETYVGNANCFVFELYNFNGDSEVYDCNFKHIISLNGGLTTPIDGSTWNLKIHDCEIDLSGMTDGLPGIEASHHYLDFYNNYIHDNGYGGGVGIWATNGLTDLSVTHIRVRNNFLYNLTHAGIRINLNNANFVSDIEIYNNVIDNISSDGWGGVGIYSIIDGENIIFDTQIKNNIIINCDARPIYLGTGCQRTKIYNNLFYGNNSNTVLDQQNDPPNEKNTVESGNITEAPEIVGSGDRPFYYKASSRSANIVDSGVDVGLPYSGSAPDIGAYEFRVASGINITNDHPLQYSLKQNYPNPFNPVTTIDFYLPEIQRVNLIIYNLLGEKLTVLSGGEYEAGYHSVRFDGSNLSSGVYICKLRVGEFTDTRKLMLIK